MPNYENGKIYKITVGDDFYIGCTTLTLEQRMRNHRQDQYRTSAFYARVREHGIENCTIELLEAVPCKTMAELTTREQYYISQYTGNPQLLNRRRACRS